jgi:hypothetical protein
VGRVVPERFRFLRPDLPPVGRTRPVFVNLVLGTPAAIVVAAIAGFSILLNVVCSTWIASGRARAAAPSPLAWATRIGAAVGASLIASEAVLVHFTPTAPMCTARQAAVLAGALLVLGPVYASTRTRFVYVYDTARVAPARVETQAGARSLGSGRDAAGVASGPGARRADAYPDPGHRPSLPDLPALDRHSARHCRHVRAQSRERLDALARRIHVADAGSRLCVFWCGH